MKILANGTLQNNIWEVDFLSRFGGFSPFSFLGAFYKPLQDKQESCKNSMTMNVNNPMPITVKVATQSITSTYAFPQY